MNLDSLYLIKPLNNLKKALSFLFEYVFKDIDPNKSTLSVNNLSFPKKQKQYLGKVHNNCHLFQVIPPNFTTNIDPLYLSQSLNTQKKAFFLSIWICFVDIDQKNSALPINNLSFL